MCGCVCVTACVALWRCVGQGGDVVTIVGANFGSQPSAVNVTIDGRDCTLLSLTDGTITCVSPPGVAALVTPLVTVSGVTSPAIAPVGGSANVARSTPPAVVAFTPAVSDVLSPKSRKSTFRAALGRRRCSGKGRRVWKHDKKYWAASHTFGWTRASPTAACPCAQGRRCRRLFWLVYTGERKIQVMPPRQRKLLAPTQHMRWNLVRAMVVLS